MLNDCIVERVGYVRGAVGACPSCSSSLLPSLELIDTKVYDPRIRALIGIASHCCEVVVLKLQCVPRDVRLSLRCTPFLYYFALRKVFLVGIPTKVDSFLCVLT